MLLLLGIWSGWQLQRNRRAECLFWRPQANDISKRLETTQYPANKPIEDRLAHGNLTSVPGFVLAVFDGHGGWQVAEFASKRIVAEIDTQIGQVKDQPSIPFEDCIRRAFAKIEEEFKQIALHGYQHGFEQFSRVGACALVALVISNKIYVANLGDSQGVIIEGDSALQIKKTNKKLNANSKKMQKILKLEFPKEANIVSCKKAKVCYVKGRLQPTHALGDFHLKFSEFNNPTNSPYLFKHDVFVGNYIKSEPQIRTFDVTPNTRGILLATDGLWDQLKPYDVLNLYKESPNNSRTFSKKLVKEALTTAARNHGMGYNDVLSLPQGSRRKIHDDISLVFVNLKHQAS